MDIRLLQLKIAIRFWDAVKQSVLPAATDTPTYSVSYNNDRERPKVVMSDL